MKKIIKKLVTLVTIWALVFTGLISNVYAFESTIGPIERTNKGKKPNNEDSYYGQTYKYSNDKTLFCTAYSLDYNENAICKLSKNWNEATRAGVAKIISSFNINDSQISRNSVIIEDNITEELLDKNLQITLAINQFLINHDNAKNESKVFKVNSNGEKEYFNPSDYFKGNTQNYLQSAEEEYQRVLNHEGKAEIKIESLGDKKVVYNPLTQSSPSSIMKITTSNIDQNTLSVKVSKGKNTIPNDIKINVYTSTDGTNFGAIKKTLTSNSNDEIIQIDQSRSENYVKFEIIDDRTDKSTGFTIIPTLYASGSFNYNVAREYKCGLNKQTITPNQVETVKEFASDIEGFTVRTQGIPDYPKLKIKKVDNNGNSINYKGAKFYITTSTSDGTQDIAVKTDENGEILFDDISDGQYCVEEVWAPSGYLVNDTQHCFAVNMDTTNGNIIKVEKSHEEVQYDSANSLITITVKNQPNKIKICKANSSGNCIAGADLVLTDTKSENPTPFKLADGTVFSWQNTTADYIEINGLPKGTYYLYETSAPEGYIINKQPTTIVSSLQDNEEKIYTVTDELTKIKIRKTDESKQPLVGAKLQITDLDGNVIAGPWTSGENGETDHTVTGLKIRTKYYLEEISAPSGYSLTSKIKFYLNDVGEVKIIEGEDPTEGNTVILSNTKNSISIGKTDVTGEKNIEGAQLQLLDANKNVIKLSTNGDVLEPSTTGTDYWFSKQENQIINKLPAGKYFIKEIKAPDGYVLSNELIEFEIDKNGNLKINNKVQDSKTLIFSNEQTKVYISKQDITNKGAELPGATLILKDKDGNEIDKWESGNEAHLIEGLGKGTYILTEITAPEGYSIAESISFTIDENGNISGDTIMYNTPIPNVPATSAFQSLLFMIIGVVLVSSGVGLYIYGIKKKKEI